MHPADLRSLLSQYPRFDAATVSPERSQQGFSGACVIRLRLGAHDLCLKGWPRGAIPSDRIRGLHRLTRHVFEHGVLQVAVPEPSRNGATWVEHDGRIWQIEPWMPGIADFETQPTEARLRDTMRCLARWHLAARTFRPQPGEAQWFRSVELAPSPAVEHRLGLIADWNARRGSMLETRLAKALADGYGNLPRFILTAFRTVAPGIEARLRMASCLQYPLQPCLRDVWHDHVLFTGDRVTGLIDLSACRTENVAADLARLLGSLLGDDRPRWSLALEEYQRDRPLSVDELALIEILDQSGVLLSGLAWLDRIYLQQESIAEPGRVLARLQRIEQRLLRLVDALSG